MSEAQAIAAAGWATDPHYAASLIAGISRYKLTQYDVVQGVTNAALARALFPLPAAAIQAGLVDLGHAVTVDGKLGPAKIAAINKADAAKLLATI